MNRTFRSAAASPRAPHSAVPALDPRNPFVYDVRALGRRAGAMREVRRTAPAPAGLGSELVGVAEGSPLETDVRLESVTEGVLVTGSVAATVTGECARCLDPITQQLEVDVQELFAWPDSATDATTDEDELPRISTDLLDLEPAVRDAIVLGLPWTPVCREDCAGLCPTCGARWDELPDDHSHEVLDPRWASLAGLVTAPDDGPPPSDVPSESLNSEARTTDRGE